MPTPSPPRARAALPPPTTAVPATPPTPRYQEKREAILGAAATLFNERGVKGATLADIAGAVGLVTNSVTYYYRKKEDLAHACFLRSIAAFNTLAAAAAREPGVPQRLQTFFRLHAQLLADIEGGQHAPLVSFSDIRALPSPQAEEVFAAYTDMFRRVRDLLKGPETLALTRDDLNARGHIVLSVVHWVRSWIDRYEPSEYLRVGDRVSDVMLHGLGHAGARWQTADGESAWQLVAVVDGAQGAEETTNASAPLDAFLRAATVLVNEQGYRGASVDKISARLNVTKGSFYHHNDNKHDLISECFERSFAVLRKALSLAENDGGSGWARACAASRALVRYQLSENGPLLRSSATSALPDEAHREQVRRTLRRLSARMGNLVVDGLMDGSIRPLDPAIAAQSLIAAINAAAELHRWLPKATMDNVADLYVRPALEGVLCPGAPKTPGAA